MAKTDKSQRPTLSINISKRRKSMGFSQDELARLVGVHVNTIKDIERGLSEGRPDTRQAIATVLKCDVWELLKPTELETKSSGEAKEITTSESAERDRSRVDRTIARVRVPTPQSENLRETESQKEINADAVAKENAHALASDIASRVITALKSEESPDVAKLSEEIRSLKEQLSKFAQLEELISAEGIEVLLKLKPAQMAVIIRQFQPGFVHPSHRPRPSHHSQVPAAQASLHKKRS